MSSFGDTLRRERELRRISIRDVSEATKINVRYLEALERNEFDYLPGGAFTRGFIRSYARYVGIDETQIINSYLHELSKQQGDAVEDSTTTGVYDSLAQHYATIDGGAESRRRRRARVLVVVGAILLALAIGAGGYYGVKYLTGDSATSEQSTGALRP